MRAVPAVKRHCPRCEGELAYIKTSTKYHCPVCSSSNNDYCVWSIQYLDGYDDCKNKIYKKPSKKIVVEDPYAQTRTD